LKRENRVFIIDSAVRGLAAQNVMVNLPEYSNVIIIFEEMIVCNFINTTWKAKNKNVLIVEIKRVIDVTFLETYFINYYYSLPPALGNSLLLGCGLITAGFLLYKYRKVATPLMIIFKQIYVHDLVTPVIKEILT